MAVSRRLRFEILRRDGMTCRYCGAKAPDVTLTVDHVVPVTLGGGDEPNNLVTACKDCNAGKSSIQPDSPLVEDVDAAALLFAKAMERAAELQRQRADDLRYDIAYFDDAWNGWRLKSSSDDEGEPLPRDSDWRESVEQWMAAGLLVDDIVDLIPVAMRKKQVEHRERWRYFCGCCWRTISERQEMARRLIEDGQV